jgi:hypothetical protein
VGFGELLKSHVGGDAPAPDDKGDTLEHVTVRPPTPTEGRAAARALRSSDGAYILDSAHYPTPEESSKRADQLI